MIPRKNPEEIQLMAEAGKLVAGCFREIEKKLKPGIKTKELDTIVYDYISGNQAIAAFKGYNGYPANICISINEEVVHGIPGDRELKNADLVSIDIGVLKNGFYGDAARSYLLPPGDPEKEKLMDITRRALEKGISAACAGVRLSDISYAIQDFVESHGYFVVRDLVGHGIGRKMHEEPQVPNFGKPGKGPILEPGMTLAIEPMVNIGTWRVETLDDNWTVVTEDGKPSAHFENTIVITNNGPQILTIDN